MKKKEYLAPTMEVVEMQGKQSLLAGSNASTSANSVEDGTLEGFDNGWN